MHDMQTVNNWVLLLLVIEKENVISVYFKPSCSACECTNLYTIFVTSFRKETVKDCNDLGPQYRVSIFCILL